MIKEFKVVKLRELIIDAKVVSLSCAFPVTETLALNRLAKRMVNVIEERFEADLDFLHLKSTEIRRGLEREVRAKHKDEGKAASEFARMLTTHKELNELMDKETEINEAKLQFGIDSPIKLTVQKGAEKKLETYVHDVKYRCQPASYLPIKSLLSLVDEGLVTVKEKKDNDQDEE